MRYAVYYTPSKDDPLTRIAARWLGRNPHDGSYVAVAHGYSDFLTAPRKYGFHGTLKAPFRLADGVTEGDLLECFRMFQDEIEPFNIPAIQLKQMGPFFALVPGDDCKPLNALAEKAVRIFEPFRAPLTEAEFAKRKPDQLSQAQYAHLETWGYPYVFDEFRFHLTLTGPVAPDCATAVQAALTQHFEAFIGQDLPLVRCALFVEPEPGAPFHVKTF